MSIYRELPNIVQVTVKDKTGESSLCVVGSTLAEVILSIEDSFGDGPTRPAKKVRKPHRTRAEMAKAEEPSAGEAAMAKLKGGEEKETAWP